MQTRSLPSLGAFAPVLLLLACGPSGSDAGIGSARQSSALSAPVNFTILHTNDLHGALEPAGSNPGISRLASAIAARRASLGTSNVLLVDAGDALQGTLLSNVGKGAPMVQAMKAMAYDARTLGNHDLDWGTSVAAERAAQAGQSWLAANVVAGARVAGGVDCASPDVWAHPDFITPYVVKTVGSGTQTLRVALIGVTTLETPSILRPSLTEGLCFRDPATAILHYYDAMRAQADLVVALSHLGYSDGGYGYGFEVYGDQSLALRLAQAGKPVPLIIGGHSHNALSTATVVEGTTVVQAHYASRALGQADLAFDPADGSISVSWARVTISTSDPQAPEVQAIVSAAAADPAYQAEMQRVVGYVQTDLSRDYNGEGTMGDLVVDAARAALNSDQEPSNDVDVFIQNPGLIRSDLCAKLATEWGWSTSSGDCSPGAVWTHPPLPLEYRQLFQVLPFGNAAVVGTMTGAQLLEVLNQSASLFKGALQVSGLRYRYYAYSDALPGPQPWAWGAFDVCIGDDAGICQPIDPARTYRVGTNEFLAPAGQDGFSAFKYMRHLSYWGDLLELVRGWLSAQHGTAAAPYRGPDGDGALDGRIVRDGTDAGGSIVPLTILHHNDGHGSLIKQGSYPGYTQLVTVIRQEQAHNPSRTLLVSSGDQVAGDGFTSHFRSAALGATWDATLPPQLSVHPAIAAMNSMGYAAMVLGEHEFDYGREIFSATFAQASFPVLGANVADDGRYGLAQVRGGAGVQPFTTRTVDGIDVALLGLTNHRIAQAQLPSGVPGLTFQDPVTRAQTLVPMLRADNDVVVALTHLGFAPDPGNAALDGFVDTALAAQVAGLDAVLGGHSHTNPSSPGSSTVSLPTLIAGPSGGATLVSQAYRAQNALGEVVLGLRAKAGGGYQVVSRAGRAISVSPSSTVEDAAIRSILQPYQDLFVISQNTTLGRTLAPIDATASFTEETTGANLLSDASLAALRARDIAVDVHLAGAVSNRKIAATATAFAPVDLKASDVSALVPVDQTLVVLELNGPQLKAVLERAYRNYYDYAHTDGFGGGEHLTSCMLVPDRGAKLMYRDEHPGAPDGDNVAALVIGGVAVDFTDERTFHRVSTYRSIASGGCNFEEGGSSLWLRGRVVEDTRLVVREAVMELLGQATAPITPQLEGRLVFGDPEAPSLTVSAPVVGLELGRDQSLTVSFSAVDTGSGLAKLEATLDGTVVVAGQVFGPRGLPGGSHVLSVQARDFYGNVATEVVNFSVANTAPVAREQALSTAHGAPVALLLEGSDAEGDTLRYQIVSGPAHGELAGTPPALTYTPKAGFSGTDAFTFTVSDGAVTSEAATVTFTVAAAPEEEPSGCGCGAATGAGAMPGALLVVLAFARRRKAFAMR